MASYVANFDTYKGQAISVTGTRGIAGGDVLVQTHIAANDGGATDLGYVVKQTPAAWKAIDVLAAGSISRVAVQRSDFRSVLASGGGDALVASLARKTADLSGGALG